MDLTENEKQEFIPIIEKLSNCFSNWLPDIDFRLFKPKNHYDINDTENTIIKQLDECYQVGFFNCNYPKKHHQTINILLKYDWAWTNRRTQCPR